MQPSDIVPSPSPVSGACERELIGCNKNCDLRACAKVMCPSGGRNADFINMSDYEKCLSGRFCDELHNQIRDISDNPDIQKRGPFGEIQNDMCQNFCQGFYNFNAGGGVSGDGSDNVTDNWREGWNRGCLSAVDRAPRKETGSPGLCRTCTECHYDTDLNKECSKIYGKSDGVPTKRTPSQSVWGVYHLSQSNCCRGKMPGQCNKHRAMCRKGYSNGKKVKPWSSDCQWEGYCSTPGCPYPSHGFSSRVTVGSGENKKVLSEKNLKNHDHVCNKIYGNEGVKNI